MKKVLSICCLLFYLISSAQTVDSFNSFFNRERIILFHSDITVHKDASLTVTEKIKVETNGNQIQHGIFRQLPITRNINGSSQSIKYSILSVKKNGETEPFTTQNKYESFNIKIGDRNIDLEPGIYTYELTYETKKQIGFFEKYDELYWNVNGNSWSFGIDSISATVKLPENAKIIQNSCYTGTSGSKNQDCSSKIISENAISWQATNLRSNEGLTIAVGFNKGAVIPPKAPNFLEKYGLLLVFMFTLIGLTIYYYRTWKKYGIDPPSPVVYPQFSAPESLSPASLGYIRSASFRDEQITAAIISLAIKGFLKITESEANGLLSIFKGKVFTLEKLKNPDPSLAEEEIQLMNELFRKGETLTLDGQYDEDLKSTVENFKANLKYQHDKLLNEGNNFSKLWIPGILISILYFMGLGISYLINPDDNKFVFGITIFAILTVIFAVITFIGNQIGKISWNFVKGFLIFGAFIFAYKLGFDEYSFGNNNFNICYIFLVFAMVSMMVYQWLIRKPSVEKLRIISLIDGFKMYMRAAEDEVLKFHNPPKMTPEFFEKLLPYAVVFGVDQIWGDKFTKYLSDSGIEYHPTYYYGGSFHNFNIGAFSGSLTSSITSASTSSSGSGGGGFSGGGGGGGGGGGW
ncbi:DUF2207 domain-containing protein [Chryseobacterium koreense]|uniref:DUF2207 domain-containing protein n=1 Tax=Chryseobacterium koreense TaxID=232216 RepID=UPI0026EDFBB7|nr:DUF2207 domain-containing protein [Chryseobacterium koreense]